MNLNSIELERKYGLDQELDKRDDRAERALPDL